MGYDIADYRQINPQYGTLKDVEVLIERLKDKNIRTIMDLVVNHTSDRHAWFQESRSSKTNPKRDWRVLIAILGSPARLARLGTDPRPPGTSGAKAALQPSTAKPSGLRPTTGPPS